MAHVGFRDDSTCLDPPDVEAPGKFEATKNGSVWKAITPTIAIFQRENDDNLMDFGWISVQPSAASGCVNFCNTLQKSRNSCWCSIYFIQTEFAASCGWQVAKVRLAHASSGLCLVDSVVAVPCFPHFSTACICQAPSNEPAHFTNLLQAIHGIPYGNKA